MKRVLALFLCTAALAGGCDDFDETEGDAGDPMGVCEPRALATVEVTAERWQYVVDSIELPSNGPAAVDVGLDLDRDGGVDNHIGQLIALVSQLSGDVDLDAELAAMVESGAILHLIEVRAVDLEASTAVARLVHGLDADGDTSDNFSGTEMFDIDTTRASGDMSGLIEGGQLSIDLGTAPVAVAFPGLEVPFVIALDAVRIEATVTAEGMVGTIAGAVSMDVTEASLVPAFHEGIVRMIARDCDPACEPNSTGELLLSQFDADRNGTVSLEEFRRDSLVDTLIEPDVDVFDADGNVVRGCDDREDALSVALPFTAVRATF